MRAFHECRLNEIELPNTLKVIGYEAFAECEGLQIIYANAFDYCEKIERLQLPESLKCIEWGSRSGIDRIYIPKGTIYIEDSIFEQLSDEDLKPIIYGQKGSRAQEVALAYGLEFVEVVNGKEMP